MLPEPVELDTESRREPMTPVERKHPQLGTPGSGLYATPSQKQETWNLEENQGPLQPRRGSPGSGAGSRPGRGVRAPGAGTAAHTPLHEGQCFGLHVTLLTLLQIRLQVANTDSLFRVLK